MAHLVSCGSGWCGHFVLCALRKAWFKCFVRYFVSCVVYLLTKLLTSVRSTYTETDKVKFRRSVSTRGRKTLKNEAYFRYFFLFQKALEVLMVIPCWKIWILFIVPFYTTFIIMLGILTRHLYLCSWQVLYWNSFQVFLQYVSCRTIKI